MGIKRILARNIIWNGVGTAAPMIAGFVVLPFLVHRLGKTGYGLWILIASLTAYFGFLDLGVRGSVGRNIAFHRAKNDQDGVNAVLSTALAILSGASLLALLGTVAALSLFFHLFPDVPTDRVAEVRLALLIIGINLALTFPANLFDATLWAFQRFDLLNAIDIPAVLLRTGLTFWLIGTGHGLVTLALITLLITAASAAAKAILSFRTDRHLRLGLALVRRDAARRIYSYGVWYFVLSVSRLVVAQISPLIIGARLAVRLVTPFSITTRLLGYATALLTAATGVLTPLMTTLHTEEKHGQQRRLFLAGGKYCLALTLFFFTWFLLLGESFLALWMGPALAATAAPLLTILALGDLLPMSQWATNSMILGMGRHKLLACASLVEICLAITLALLWVGPYGLAGVCVALAIPGALCRGVLQLVYGCRLAQVAPGQYVTHTLLPAVAAAALPALLLVALCSWKVPHSWLQLVVYTGVYGVAHLACCAALVGFDRLKGGGVKLPQVATGKRAARETVPAAALAPEAALVGAGFRQARPQSSSGSPTHA